MFIKHSSQTKAPRLPSKSDFLKALACSEYWCYCFLMKLVIIHFIIMEKLEALWKKMN